MAVNIFEDKTKSIPKDDGTDSKVVRVPFSHTGLGARKSHLAAVAKKDGKNMNSIKHVKGA